MKVRPLTSPCCGMAGKVSGRRKAWLAESFKFVGRNSSISQEGKAKIGKGTKQG